MPCRLWCKVDVFREFEPDVVNELTLGRNMLALRHF